MASAASRLSPARTAECTRAVLGARYDLSVAYVDRRKMRRLNAAYRRTDRATDILSFPLSKNSGEIVLCLPEVATHARAFNMEARAYLPYLFIHGLVHLKGHAHGRIMDRLERRFCRTLGITHPDSKPDGAKNRSGHRRGHLSGARRRRSL